MENITSDALINDYIRRYGSDNESIDESLFKAVVDDTLTKIVPKQYNKIDIVTIEIRNNKGRLPKNYIEDIQCVFRLKPKLHMVERISEIKLEIPGVKCHQEITIKCPLCHQENCHCGKPIMELDTDLIWRMTHPEHIAAMSKFFADFYNPEKSTDRNVLDSRWYLMRRTVDNWFATKYYSKTCKMHECKAIEYRIVGGDIIVNFDEGQVMLAYFGENLDEYGYRMIPNEPRVIDALMTAVLHLNMSKKFFKELTPDLRIALNMLDMKLEREILRARVELDWPTYNELISICQNVLRKMFDPYHWYSGGMTQADQYNPSNNYNIHSKY
jgi:hypothetical protein